MDAIAVVQARMSSTRLPGKVLADVGGEPLLALMLRRLAAARAPAEIVVATSTDPGDDPIAGLGEALGVRVHRGPLDDVLARFVGAIGDHDGLVARLTADCPLIDPAVVDAVLERAARDPGCAYVSNVDPRVHPDGLDVEVMPARVLRILDAEVADPEGREHVTLGLVRDPARWRRCGVDGGSPELGALRWTVDTPEDLAFVRAVVERLGERRHVAGLHEVLAAVRREPSLAAGGLRG